MNNPPPLEDRIWAVLSHLSALAMGMGILLPIIGWSEQRRKSKYAAFQCLQALGYQSLGYTVWLLGCLLLIVALLVVMVVMSFVGDGMNNINAYTAVWTGIFFVIISGTLGIYLLLPIIAAIACGLGKDFRYPIMGNRIALYLGYDPAKASDEPPWLIEEHEDRWVSAMGHVSVIIPLWGILAPATAWILQGRHSLFLKFQSAQTVTYQVLVNLLYMGSGALYMVGFVIFIALTGFEVGAGNQPSAGTMVGLIVLIISMLVAMIIVMIVPLLHILGQWAGYRVLKGDDYRYPVLGKLVERRITHTTLLKPPGI